MSEAEALASIATSLYAIKGGVGLMVVALIWIAIAK